MLRWCSCRDPVTVKAAVYYSHRFHYRQTIQCPDVILEETSHWFAATLPSKETQIMTEKHLPHYNKVAKIQNQIKIYVWMRPVRSERCRVVLFWHLKLRQYKIMLCCLSASYLLFIFLFLSLLCFSERLNKLKYFSILSRLALYITLIICVSLFNCEIIVFWGFMIYQSVVRHDI